MNPATHVKQWGTSLAELAVGLAIVSTGLAMAVPSLNDFVETKAVSAAAEDIFSDLRQTRAEALKRNGRVTMCKSADGDTCSLSGGWEQGWLMFHDENNNGRRDSGEEAIVRHGPLSPRVRIKGNTPVKSYVSYGAIGSTRLLSGGFQAGTLTVCSSSAPATSAREIVLNAVGRPRMQKATTFSCV